MTTRPDPERLALSQYLSEVRGLSRLSEDEERQLRRDLADGKPDAFGRLVESALGFVIKIAMEYRGYGLALEDLLNEGNLGLVEAARRFDVGRGTKFTTYAVWWIRKTILAALASSAATIRSPYTQTKKIQRIRDAEATLQRSLARPPTRDEIAKHLGVPVAEIDLAIQRDTRAVSLSRSGSGDPDSGWEPVLRDRGAPSPEQQVLRRESRRNLIEALRRLTAQQQFILERRYGFVGERAVTLRELAEEIGVSRERVRQIELAAKIRLRKLLARG